MVNTYWYPKDKDELNKVLDKFLSSNLKINQGIHGLIVPHAGYIYSGEVAGKAYSLLKNQAINKAIIFGPSHYANIDGISTIKDLKTPLGEARFIKNNLDKLDYEHSIENQIPFLQKLNNNIEIYPIVVGEIPNKEAEKLAKEFSKEKSIYIFSTDLSHFLPYEEAVKKDKRTIEIIENLDIKNFEELDACGKFPLMIMMYLCKLNKWKPRLIEYKNSGDIIFAKSSVVGYASFWF